MSDPRARLLRLNAALDGELDAMDQAAFDREIRDDPALAADFRRLRTTRDAVRRAAPRETAPAALAARLAALAEPPVAPRSVASPARLRWRAQAWSARGALALAASFAALGFVLGVGLTTLKAPDAARGADVALVTDFTRAAISGQPYDVASSDRHTVKPWLAGRTTVSANVIDLAERGFPLAGGRVSVVDRIPAPTLVYRRHEHLIALTELPLDAPGARKGGGIESIDGYHVARWTGAGLGFIAVTDADEATLREFVTAFDAARKPAAEDDKRP